MYASERAFARLKLKASEDWFAQTLGSPTQVQQQAWEKIQQGANVVVSAPTGKGKTLAAFFTAIDDLYHRHLSGTYQPGVKVLYISPLKALSTDISENLRNPIDGIKKNLEQELGYAPELKVALRTGDTTAAERRQVIKSPPDFLITTPESLFILVSSASGRKLLEGVEQVIIDEIHALQGSKRGAHLALSMAQINLIATKPVQWLGLSATMHPLSVATKWLTCEPVEIVQDQEKRRPIDVEVLLPAKPMSAILSNAQWEVLYDELARIIQVHQTTLLFVGSRRLAERLSANLSLRLGEQGITSHHGSLSFEHRRRAEGALKSGELKAVVATSALELGIDVGVIDLVVQLGSITSINTLVQRIGRSGRGFSQRPKGLIIPLKQTEALEAAAFQRAIELGIQEEIAACHDSVDVLMQHLSSLLIDRELTLEQVAKFVRSCSIYEHWEDERIEAILVELARGFSERFSRRRPLIYYDQYRKIAKDSKGTRLTVLVNAGVIPDQFDYPVVLEPEGIRIGSLNEDFALESMPGVIVQLGNHPYRFSRLEDQVIKVTDAQGQPPVVPFWFGEGPSRSIELCSILHEFRASYQELALENKEQKTKGSGLTSEPSSDPLSKLSKSKQEKGLISQLIKLWSLPEDLVTEIHGLLGDTLHKLGALPTDDTVVFERFYDEAGDAHLVVHTGMGARLNRAWGLSLRKRFCGRFNFELQAAGTDDSIILSLGATHSFDLLEPAHYLKSHSAHGVLVQALLDAPIFNTRWRWVACNALAVKRRDTRGRVPPPIQRSIAEDLLSLVFPDQVACLENIQGARDVPEHPLVQQTIYDCTQEYMDSAGMQQVLGRLENNELKITGSDCSEPSALAYHVITASPFAYLDEAGLEDRRTRAIAPPSKQEGGLLPSATALKSGFPSELIGQVQKELLPPIENGDDLLYLLGVLGFFSQNLYERYLLHGYTKQALDLIVDGLQKDKRMVQVIKGDKLVGWCQPGALVSIQAVWLKSEDTELGHSTSNPMDIKQLVQQYMDILGPVTLSDLGAFLPLADSELSQCLLALKQHGYVAQGPYCQGEDSWCQQEILIRLFRRLKQSRRERYPQLSVKQYIQFLSYWQGVTNEQGQASAARQGEQALFKVLEYSEGIFMPFTVWERDYLPARVQGYKPAWLDQLLLSGQWQWQFNLDDRQGISTQTPMTFLQRRHLNPNPQQIPELDPEKLTDSVKSTSEVVAQPSELGLQEEKLSSQALALLKYTKSIGAVYTSDYFEYFNQLPDHLRKALSQLIGKGLLHCDSMEALRYLLKPVTRGYRYRKTRNRMLDIPGRWSLTAHARELEKPQDAELETAQPFVWQGEYKQLIEILLKRYGVLSYNIVRQEKQTLPPWRLLAQQARRMEAAGQLVSGRFVKDGTGEQFTQATTLSVLKAYSKSEETEDEINPEYQLNACDPIARCALQLAETLTNEHRTIAKRATNSVVIKQGVVVRGEVRGELVEIG